MSEESAAGGVFDRLGRGTGDCLSECFRFLVQLPWLWSGGFGRVRTAEKRQMLGAYSCLQRNNLQ